MLLMVVAVIVMVYNGGVGRMLVMDDGDNGNNDHACSFYAGPAANDRMSILRWHARTLSTTNCRKWSISYHDELNRLQTHTAKNNIHTHEHTDTHTYRHTDTHSLTH